MTGLKRDMTGLIVLVLVSTGIGLLINQFHTKPLSLVYQSKTERIERTVLAMDGGASKIEVESRSILTLEQFRDFVNGKKGVVLDARPAIFFRLGHVPGAVSLPRDDFERAYANHRMLLEKGKKQAIAIYCSGEDCEDSDLLHRALVQLGYQNVSIFRGGWAEWTRAGLSEEQEP